MDCPHLQDARRHEANPIASLDDFPNQDIKVTEEFIRSHEHLVVWFAVSLLRTSLQTPGAVDNDVKAALDALIRTYRTRQSGLYYETRPDNAVAAAIMDGMHQAVDELRRRVEQSSGVHNIRDVDVLGVFAFLQRLEIQHSNRRRLGRAFIDWLRSGFGTPAEPASDRASSIIV